MTNEQLAFLLEHIRARVQWVIDTIPDGGRRTEGIKEMLRVLIDGLDPQDERLLSAMRLRQIDNKSE